VTLLDAGDTLMVSRRSSPWIRVAFEGRTGWVHERYVESVASNPATVDASSGLRLRSGPGTRYRSLGTLPDGAEVRVVDRRGNWRKVEHRGRVGWAYGRYLDERPAEASPARGDAAVPAEPAAPAIASADAPGAAGALRAALSMEPGRGRVAAHAGEDGAGSDTAGTPGDASGSRPGSAHAAVSQPGAGRSSAADPPAALAAGSPSDFGAAAGPAPTTRPEATRIAAADAGSSTREAEGAPASDAADGPSAAASPPEGLVTAPSGLRVRSGPGTRHRIIGTLPRGSRVPLLERDGWWIRVPYQATSGWVHRMWIEEGTPGDGAGGSVPASAPRASSQPDRSAGAGSVVYQRRVSDSAVRRALERLANHLGRTVVVHSGDRRSVPRGGSRRSLHMAGRAADFHVRGMSDGAVFYEMRRNHAAILGGGSFEVIYHKADTNTGGPHIHLGNYNDRRGTYYKLESRGRYRTVAHHPR
jgi:uncharacterized protein YraI